MESRALGGTGLSVTPMGLGMAALGRPGYINLGHADDLEGDYNPEAMRLQAERVLDAAWAAGVRYFDAARSYGRGEEFLGGWLRSRHIDPGQVTIGSKWGYTYTAGWQVEADKHEVKEHTAPVLRRQIAESRSHLGDYLRLYQIHSATLDSGVLDNGEVLDELARLRDGGLVIGLSLSGTGQAETLRKILTVERGSKLLFGIVQATWNLLERSAETMLAEAKSAGLGIIVKEALANGRLTSRNHDPAFRDRLALLEEAAASQQVPVDALALAAASVQPWADVVLSGAATEAHLQSNLQAMRVNWSEALADQLAPLCEPAENYWKTRGQLEWN